MNPTFESSRLPILASDPRPFPRLWEFNGEDDDETMLASPRTSVVCTTPLRRGVSSSEDGCAQSCGNRQDPRHSRTAREDEEEDREEHIVDNHRGYLSKLAEDDDATNLYPLCDLHHEQWGAGDGPRTAPRAPKKPIASCSRRKSSSLALGVAHDIAALLPPLTDDEGESLSQRTFERMLALQLPGEEDEGGGRPTIVDESSRPILQSAFSNLTLQSSPSSKQLLFDDAVDSPIQGGVPAAVLAAIMPATDAIKARGSGRSVMHKDTARQRLLEKRRRRGRNEDDAAATGTSTPPSRNTVSCPLFGGGVLPRGGATAQQMLRGGEVTKPLRDIIPSTPSPNTRPAQRPRLV